MSRGPDGSGAATLAKIAREAGVSAPTVSRVLNGRADVAAETRARVEALISKHGYQRRGGAKATPSPMLDLVFHELDSAWAVEVIKGVTRVAREEGLIVVLSESAGRITPGQSWVDGVLARRPTGVILVLSDLSSAQRTQLTTRNIPFVVVDPAGDPAEGVPAIGSANWNGGLAATRHLLELGHRRIGVIGGPPSLLCSRARLDGYRAAMETAGVRIDPALVHSGNFHIEGGYDNGMELLGLPDPPTAIFAGSDLQALGLYEAARELGLRIPADLSVVGYDDLPVARWVGPPLTTIRQPLTEMAEAAARLVISIGRGEEPTTLRLDLSTSLVTRQSTAPPRAR
jgi:LacI family xylobiose transport system transcriptional regulator